MKTGAYFIGLMALMVFTVGCGANNIAQTTDSASTDPVQTPEAIGTTHCNKASANNDFEVKLMSYADASGNRNNSFIRLKITKIPSIYVSDGLDIHIKKWTVSPSNITSPAPGAAPYYVDTRIDFKNSNGSYSAASSWNYNLDCDSCPNLVWSNMQLIAGSLGIATTDAMYTNPVSFFERFQPFLDLKEAKRDWKALEVNLVNSANVTVRSIKILIPTFAANPSEYQSSHPAELNKIHPFINMLNQGWSTSQFQTEANTYCF